MAERCPQSLMCPLRLARPGYPLDDRDRGASAGAGRGELQVADAAADLRILGIAGGFPECLGHTVVEGDQGRNPTDTAAAQVLLSGPRQGDPDALPPMTFPNSKPVHVPSPPVPAGDQSTDDLPVVLGHQKGGRGISDQALNVVEPVSRRGVLTPRFSP